MLKLYFEMLSVVNQPSSYFYKITGSYCDINPLLRGGTRKRTANDNLHFMNIYICVTNMFIILMECCTIWMSCHRNKRFCTSVPLTIRDNNKRNWLKSSSLDTALKCLCRNSVIYAQPWVLLQGSSLTNESGAVTKHGYSEYMWPSKLTVISQYKI